MKKRECYVKQYCLNRTIKAAVVMGYRVYIKNDHAKIDSVVYKNDTFNIWHVVECSTGLSYGSGKTKKAAVENAIKNIPLVLKTLNSDHGTELKKEWCYLLENVKK